MEKEKMKLLTRSFIAIFIGVIFSGYIPDASSFAGQFLYVDGTRCDNVLYNSGWSGWQSAGGIKKYILTGKLSNSIFLAAWYGCRSNSFTTMSGQMPMATVYAPGRGNYAIVLYICGGRASGNCTPAEASWHANITSYAPVDMGAPIGGQNIPVISGTPPNYDTGTACYALVSDTGKVYSIPGTTASCYGAGLEPAPPEPVNNSTCIINNNNNLQVGLGTLDRSQIVTVPGSSPLIEKTFSIVCEGGNTISVNMQLKYTPITVSNKQVINSSTDGLGVAINYNGQILSPTDVVPLQLLIGTNTLTLGFEAVRDPNIPLKEITTGAFTASAVLVMTQQ